LLCNARIIVVNEGLEKVDRSNAIVTAKQIGRLDSVGNAPPGRGLRNKLDIDAMIERHPSFPLRMPQSAHNKIGAAEICLSITRQRCQRIDSSFADKRCQFESGTHLMDSLHACLRSERAERLNASLFIESHKLQSGHQTIGVSDCTVCSYRSERRRADFRVQLGQGFGKVHAIRYADADVECKRS
jgi:hypothetical protein